MNNTTKLLEKTIEKVAKLTDKEKAKFFTEITALSVTILRSFHSDDFVCEFLTAAMTDKSVVEFRRSRNIVH